MHKQLQRSGLNNATAIADVIAYVANLPMNPAPQKRRWSSCGAGQEDLHGFLRQLPRTHRRGQQRPVGAQFGGQHYDYLRDQMRRMAQAKRSNVSEDLHRMFTTYSNQ